MRLGLAAFRALTLESPFVRTLGLAGALALAGIFALGFTLVLMAVFALAPAFGQLPFILFAIAVPRSAGERTVVTFAASSAANLSAAVPLPPEITAPA